MLDLTLNISNLSHQCNTSDFLVKFSIMDLCVNIVNLWEFCVLNANTKDLIAFCLNPAPLSYQAKTHLSLTTKPNSSLVHYITCFLHSSKEANFSLSLSLSLKSFSLLGFLDYSWFLFIWVIFLGGRLVSVVSFLKYWSFNGSNGSSSFSLGCLCCFCW